MFWMWLLSEITLCVDLLKLRQITSPFQRAQKHILKHSVYTNLTVNGLNKCTSSYKYQIINLVI